MTKGKAVVSAMRCNASLNRYSVLEELGSDEGTGKNGDVSGEANGKWARIEAIEVSRTTRGERNGHNRPQRALREVCPEAGGPSQQRDDTQATTQLDKKGQAGDEDEDSFESDTAVVDDGKQEYYAAEAENHGGNDNKPGEELATPRRARGGPIDSSPMWNTMRTPVPHGAEEAEEGGAGASKAGSQGAERDPAPRAENDEHEDQDLTKTAARRKRPHTFSPMLEDLERELP